MYSFQLSTFVSTLLLLSTVSTQEISIENSKFCSICKCNNTAKIVTCENIKLEINLNETDLWKQENTSYPFEKIIIKGSGIHHIIPLPESPVKILDLSWNSIEVIDDESFKYFQNMTELNLSNNDLQSNLFDPDIFKGLYAEDEYLPLKSLKVLRLANNNLHTLHQDIFEHIMNLEVLDLHGNPLRIIDTQTLIALGGLRYLRDLDLSYTNLKKLPSTIFHATKDLHILNLSGNLFPKIPKNALDNTHNLKFLSLNENPIINITKDNGFPKLENLKILHLCYMPNLTEIDAGGLAGLWNVEELHISHNPKFNHFDKNALMRIDDNNMETWPLVHKFYIKDNKLTHISSDLLARWDLIDDIDISDNVWTCECENQWLIDTLIKFVIEKNQTHSEALKCAAPIEMEGKFMEELYKDKNILRCMPLDGSHPENDAGILVGILIGLLIGIPLVLGLMFCYKKQFFGYCSTSPAAFSRKFYNPAANEEEFYS